MQRGGPVWPRAEPFVLLRSCEAVVGFPPGPEELEVAEEILPRRSEFRIPVKTFVNLSAFGERYYEIASTIDLSSHGARVLTRRSWQPNQKVSIRLIRGTLNCRARVVHCQPYTEDVFVIGIETIGEWTVAERRPGREKSDAFKAQLVYFAEVFHELFELLEQHAPLWYTEEQHNRALAALSIMRSALKKYGR